MNKKTVYIALGVIAAIILAMWLYNKYGKTRTGAATTIPMVTKRTINGTNTSVISTEQQVVGNCFVERDTTFDKDGNFSGYVWVKYCKDKSGSYSAV